MGTEVLKDLIREVEKLEALSFEKMNELEVMYEVPTNSILSLHTEIQKIKVISGRNHLTAEIILMVMEESLINAIFDFESYTNLMATFNIDDERLEEARRSQKLALNKIKRYSMLLGIDEKDLTLINPKK